MTRVLAVARFVAQSFFVGLALIGCSADAAPPRRAPSASSASASSASLGSAPPRGGAVGGAGASLPLSLVADVALPGAANRFDYQDVDRVNGHLVIAHMSDASVIVVALSDGAVVKVLPNLPSARGIAVAADVGRIFVTSSPNQLVVFDALALTEIARVRTGASPDGVAWDPIERVVLVSDQGDGAVSLIADAGGGARVQLKVGAETGNVVFDATRGVFWVAAPQATGVDRLVSIDPRTKRTQKQIELPGCAGAHGLRLDSKGATALVACEVNAVLARVDLDGAHEVVTAKVGLGPDVLALDPELGWLYVAAESGDLTVFDLSAAGLAPIDREHPDDHAHSVAVDPASHRVFFPLPTGSSGTPVLRIMKPRGV
ncbi:MAG: hypothetical protein U0414_35215 [Polyangiaceae bacterium]